MSPTKKPSTPLPTPDHEEAPSETPQHITTDANQPAPDGDEEQDASMIVNVEQPTTRPDRVEQVAPGEEMHAEGDRGRIEEEVEASQDHQSAQPSQSDPPPSTTPPPPPPPPFVELPASPPAAEPERPDWMTDELDESWNEPGQSNDKEPENDPPASEQTTTHVGEVRLLSITGVTSRSPFFDARESVALHSSQGIGANTRRHARETSLSDTELQPGPSTPSKRKVSHLHQRASRSESRSPFSAPEDFESARGSFMSTSAIGAQDAFSAAVGTFIHKADVSSLPPIFRPAWQSPDKHKGGRKLASIGGDMFTPMKLQSMFKTPTPPEKPAVLNLANAMATEDEDVAETPRPRQHALQEPMAHGVEETEGGDGEGKVEGVKRAQVANHSCNFPPEIPSVPFTFQSPRITHTGLFPASSGAQARTPSRDQPTSQRPNLLTRPASAAAAFGVTPPGHYGGTLGSAGGAAASGPSTPHTPMRLFRFNYEDAATRARLEMLVNKNSPMATGDMPETERERKRLRLDAKPRKVAGGDLMTMQLGAGADGQRMPSSPLPDHLARSGLGGNHGFGLGLSPRSEGAQPVEAKRVPAPVTFSPFKSALTPPIVDYVKEAPDFMEQLQQMACIGSDSSIESRVWKTDEEADQVGQRERFHDQVVIEDGTPRGAVAFHQGVIYVSPAKGAKTPAQRHRDRRSLAFEGRRQDDDSEIIAISRSPSGSPHRVSTRRFPANSTLHTNTMYDQSIPPMSSTLKSRQWISKVGRGIAEEESPRKLLRRFSAAAQAEEEVKGEMESGSLTRRTKDSGEQSNNWSDESLRRDEEIRKLEEKLARRADERSHYEENTRSQDIEWAEEEERNLGQPQYITLHEPTLEPIDDSGRHTFYGEADEDPSKSWDDDEEDFAHNPARGPRTQNGIILYDSEKIIPSRLGEDRVRALRNVASEAQLRSSRQPPLQPVQANSASSLGEIGFTGPQHPSTVNPVRKVLPSSQYLFSTSEEARRGERTVSSNTLVEGSNHFSVNSRVGDFAAQRNPSSSSRAPAQGFIASSNDTFGFGSTINSIGATIIRKGSMLNISQIPEEEIENLGGGKLTYDKDLNRWVKKKPSLNSFDRASRNSVSIQGDAEPVEDQQARGRGSALEKKSTTRTPVEPPIPEASIETSRTGNVETNLPQRWAERWSNKYTADTSVGTDTKFSDSSDPFKDFESFGQSTVAGEQSMEQNTAEDRAENRQSSAAQPPPSRSTFSFASSVAAGRTAVAPLLPSVRRPINTMPKSSSSLRNVVTYSPESTARSSMSGATGTIESRMNGSPRAEEAVRHRAANSHLGPSTALPGAQRQWQNPVTPERQGSGGSSGLTPTTQTRLDTPPRSILKPSPSRNGGIARSPYGRSPLNGASANGTRSISFAESPTTHQFDARCRAEIQGSDLSQSFDQSWSEDNEPTLRAQDPSAFAGKSRADAISLALRQLAELTLNPDERSASVTRARTPSRNAGALPSRSPWSYRALRHPRKEHDEDDDDETYDELHGYPDMTLLTDASFNFAHDKILEAITDVEPWEPGWEELRSIDLSERRVESCVRLKEFLPSLEEIKLDGNELSYLTGLPASLTSLTIAHNRLTNLVSFGHLLHLEMLDISHNQIESLAHLACLKHLHTLHADKIGLSSLEGIDRLSGLLHVSLAGNQLRGINLDRTEWRDLDTLNLSHNDLVTVRGISSLSRLRSLNLDHNRLSRVDLGPSMPKLRVLRVSGNTSLTILDVLPARKLRTLYADYCALHSIQNLDLLTRLDNLSMRQQVEASLVWPAHQLRDVRRLFLSGNAFPHGLELPPLIEPIRFLNLVYLELAACQLTILPALLAELAPNLRSLNLDHNLISNLPPLQGMQRLKRLSVVGCRIKKSRNMIKAVRGLRELQVVDTRTNPCTLGLYPPLMVPATEFGVELDPRHGETGAARLPPVPNPAVVQPDRERRKPQPHAAEMSYFHKRHPVDIAAGQVDRPSPLTPSITALFCAADQRFHSTLPKGFKEKRILHRGLLAMSCPRLNWVDGLFVEEEEMVQADELVRAQIGSD